MSKDNLTICTTCLIVNKDNVKVSSLRFMDTDDNVTSTYAKLHFFLPELDLRIFKTVVLCKTCFESMHSIYEFKYQCNETEEDFNNYIYSNNSSASTTDFIKILSITKCIIRSKKVTKININEMKKCSNICRICLHVIGSKSKEVSSNFLEKICKKLYLCYPELDWHAVPNSTLCENCCTAVDFAYEFKNQYYETEKQITEDFESLLDFVNSVKCFDDEDIKAEEVNITDSESDGNLEQNQADDVTETLPNIKHYQCPDEYTHLFNKNLIWVLSDVAGTPYYQCYVCGFKTYTKPVIDVHLKTHKDSNTNSISKSTDKTLFKCSCCDFSTNIRYNLKKHMLSHTKTKYQCSQCDCSYTLQRDLNKHMRTHTTQTNETLYKCTQCNYTNKDKLSFTQHICIHMAKKPFKCGQCDYQTDVRKNFKTHIFSHVEETMFKCPKCEFCATLKHNLTIHIRSHANEKPYHCPHCKHTFRTNVKLKKHSNVHLVKKRSKHCDLCITSASTSKIKTHTSKRTFKCSFCNYSSKQKRFLDKHVLTHKSVK